MIVGICMTFILIGVMCGFIDLFYPVIPFIYLFSMKIVGMMLIIMGAVILGARIMQTGADAFVDMPSKNNTILIHSRRGKNPNASILKGKLLDLEFIKVKRKLFKDTGGGVRICGHDVRFTHETISHDIPQWLGQYLHQIKNRYGIHNNHDLKTLYEQLQKLKPPLPGVITLEDQLNRIKELDPVMKDIEKRKKLLELKYDEIKNMTENIWDGKVIHMEDAEDFIESAPPNELDSYVTQEAAHTLMRIKRYNDPGEINWGQWVPIVLVLLVGGAIAVAIIYGVFH